MRHIESKLQRQCVRYARLQYPVCCKLLFAVPNGLYTTAIQGRIAKEEGVVAGVADLLLLVPRGGYIGLAIEMKTAKGRQTDSQKAWQQAFQNAGGCYKVVRSFDEFKSLIDTYLSWK